jgi:hypothetical protein
LWIRWFLPKDFPGSYSDWISRPNPVKMPNRLTYARRTLLIEKSIISPPLNSV